MLNKLFENYNKIVGRIDEMYSSMNLSGCKTVQQKLLKIRLNIDVNTSLYMYYKDTEIDIFNYNNLRDLCITWRGLQFARLCPPGIM